MPTGVSKLDFRKRVFTVNSQYLPPLTPLKRQTVIELLIFCNSKQPLRWFLHFFFSRFSVVFFAYETPNRKHREGGEFLSGSPPFPPSILSNPYDGSCSLPSGNGKRLHETSSHPKKYQKNDFLGLGVPCRKPPPQRGPQEDPRGPREGPQRPRRPPKRAPRGPQDGPRVPKRPPKRAPRGPQEAPRGPQESPRGHQEDPRRIDRPIDRSIDRSVDGSIHPSIDRSKPQFQKKK